MTGKHLQQRGNKLRKADSSLFGYCSCWHSCCIIAHHFSASAGHHERQAQKCNTKASPTAVSSLKQNFHLYMLVPTTRGTTCPVFVLRTPTALPQKQVCNLLFETSLNTDACFVWRHERKPLPLRCYVQLPVCSEENQELPPICINFEVSCFSSRAK